MNVSERGRHWLALALVVTASGIAACGGDDGDETGTSAKESGQPILIRTHVAPLNARGETFGEVLSGSTIGDSAFCAGGRFDDAHGEPPLGLVVKRFRCPDGTLTITFSPTQPSLKQSSDWHVAKGLGRFEGVSGGGRMRAVFESGVGEGRETFTGTVTR
jgi:hypothetical protein